MKPLRFFSTLLFGLQAITMMVTSCTGAQVSANPTSPPPATPAATIPPLPTATPTLFPTPQLPSGEWSWYENEDYGYRIAHPNTWTHIVEWDEEWNEQTYEYLVIHRDRSYSETAEVIVDIWNISKTEGFDLVDWLNKSEGITLGESNETNATISGLDAVFQFQPASGMIGDLAQLIFTNGKSVFRIFFTSGAIPSEAADIQIFIDSMKSFTLLSGPSGPLSIPSGWEK